MKVVIVGATHGNEKTGAWLIEKWKTHPDLLPSQHEYLLMIGNPKALEQNTRYVDFDLNRSFNGGNQDSKTYEYHRARELKNKVKEWSKGDDVFLIDLHTTTSNMGTTLILSDQERLNAWVLKKAQIQIPEARLLFSFFDQQNIYLNSLSRYGALVEIGPAPQNLLLGSAIELMEAATLEILKALPQNPPNFLEPVVLEGFLEGDEVLYPMWKDKRYSSHIHPHLQNKDFELLQTGDPIFISQDGKTLHYEGEDTYPIFINEAAYYVKDFAFTKAQKTKMTF
ncbi:MAG: aspartoacylase [Bdellovibrionaceae bacterium]|nr:aspartoacylase [Pseudobdellovibrionaceae bacterium]